MMPSDILFYPLIPEILLTVLAVGVLVLDLFLEEYKKSLLGYVSVAGLICILIVIPFTLNDTPFFGAMIISDNFSAFFDVIFILAAIITILLSTEYLSKNGIQRGEFYYLVLFATLGMMVMAGSYDLISMYVSLELMALSVYILVAFRENNKLSIEAALKYFILGAFSSAILLYGITFIYGFTGSTNLNAIALYMTDTSFQPIYLLGVFLIIVGFCFKVAAFPFHVWTPDAYEGAPTPVTAFMSVAPKAAAFAVFLRVFIVAFPDLQPFWSEILWVISILTMLFGSVVAIAQKNIIRMLAYSSIAHVGTILIGLLVFNTMGLAGVLYYLLVYAFMNLGAFSVIIFCIGKNRKGEFIKDYKGLAGIHPVITFLLALFFLSLAGVPPTGGFVAKFYILAAAIDEGYYILATVGVVSTAISLFFYVRVIFYMYMREPETDKKLSISMHGKLILGLLALGVIILGVYPAPFINFALNSIKGLL